MGYKTFQITLARPNDAEEISSLLFEAFRDKFLAMMHNNEHKIVPLLKIYYTQILNNPTHNIIVLKLEGKLVGVLIISGKGIPIINEIPRSVIKQAIHNLGLRTSIRLGLGFLILESTPRVKDRLYINTIAVKKEYRGRGIGKLLINLCDKIATQRKITGVCLYVADNNKSAIQFYRKLGFTNKETERIFLFYLLFRVKSFYYLEKIKNFS